jgi:hypothetical protein
MTRHLTRALLVLTVVVTPFAAAAQSASQPRLPNWDSGATFGIHWGHGWDSRPSNSYSDEPDIAYQLDLGRFWTKHLKTDFGLVLRPTQRDYDYQPYPLPGIPGAYTFTNRDHSLTTFAAAATYQFFENEMMHPFVSAGMQIGVIDEHRYRYPQTYTSNRVPYNVPALDERSTHTLARPFFAVGAKSYFNERTYVKSEFLMAAHSGGFSHATLRLGFGFDF